MLLEVVEILLRIVPNEQEVKAFREYEVERKPIEVLADEDKFMISVSLFFGFFSIWFFACSHLLFLCGHILLLQVQVLLARVWFVLWLPFHCITEDSLYVLQCSLACLGRAIDYCRQCFGIVHVGLQLHDVPRKAGDVFFDFQ